jgi:hypothetical protein
MDFAQLQELVKDNADAVTFVKEFAGKLPDMEAKLALLPDLEAKVAGATKLETDIANLKSINADLESQKANWKKGHSGTQAEFNALKEQIAANEAATKALNEKLTNAEKEAGAAKEAKRESDLKASVVASASKLKGREPDDDFILLKAKGLTGIDAEGKPFYNKLNDQGQPVKLNSADELMAWYYDRDKSRVSGSGIGGAGANHTGGGGESGTISSREQARAGFRAARGV